MDKIGSRIFRRSPFTRLHVCNGTQKDRQKQTKTGKAGIFLTESGKRQTAEKQDPYFSRIIISYFWGNVKGGREIGEGVARGAKTIIRQGFYAFIGIRSFLVGEK